MMMQMLAAGGMELLSDGVRAADADNPRGYFEWEPAKRLSQEPEHLAAAEGKAVKIISSLLAALPPGRQYRVLFMHRPMNEVVASQGAMLQRRGTEGSTLAPTALAAALEDHVRQVTEWLDKQRHMRVCHVHYRRLLQQPEEELDKVLSFLEMPLNREAMLRQIDAALYRHRHD